MNFFQKSFIGFVSGGMTYSILENAMLPEETFRYYKRTYYDFFVNVGSYIGLTVSIYLCSRNRVSN